MNVNLIKPRLPRFFLAANSVWGQWYSANVKTGNSIISPIKVQAFCAADAYSLSPIHKQIATSPQFAAKFISNDILWVNETNARDPFAGCLVTWQLEQWQSSSFKQLIAILNSYQEKKMFFSAFSSLSPPSSQPVVLPRLAPRSSPTPSTDVLSLLNCSPMEADEINLSFIVKNEDGQDGSSALADVKSTVVDTKSDLISITTYSPAGQANDPSFLLEERVAISYALARSVRIGFLEHLLDDHLMGCRHREISLKLATSGSFKGMARADALKALGQMIYCRGQLNLYHSRLQLTDSSPDLFWDSSSLLDIYTKISGYLEAPIRIAQLNKKMDYATEITGLVRTTLTENHSHFLEVMIILLICIEVGFECFHYLLLFEYPHVLGIN